jgi:hypothetical protein
MPKKKLAKHPKDMNNEELASLVFHPKVLRHAKRHIKRLNRAAKLATRKKSAK